MAELPRPTVDAIDAWYAKRNGEPPRDYLGASLIGKACTRQIWYQFRHAAQEQFDGRILRLFETGHREESRMIDMLRAIGCEVLDKDPATGEQWRFSDINGHLSCGLDGVVRGLQEAPKTWHLLECKTHNRKSFDDLEKQGVAKSKPEHMAQMQLCMGMADLDRGLYFAKCKDTDRLYAERVDFDAKAHKAVLLKAKRIIDAAEPLERISEDPSYYVCKFCPFAGICRGETTPSAVCRTCVHATPTKDKQWACDHGNPPAVCGEHLLIPGLLEFAEPTDGGDGFVVYANKHNGAQFINCAATAFPALDMPHYSSEELANCHPKAIGNQAVEAARRILGGKVVDK